MNFEKELLKFIDDKQKVESPFVTTLEELSIALSASKSDIKRALKMFIVNKYCFSVFEEGDGTIVILPVSPEGLKLIQ